MYMKNLFLFESGGRQNFGAEAMIIHNSWTDRAREPLKTSLDTWDSKESNERDKNMRLHLKVLWKIHICEVSLLKF